MRYLIALAAAALLWQVWSGVAEAQPLGPRAASLAVWGKLPCNGDFTLRYAPLPGLQVGESRWYFDGTRRFGCRVTIDPRKAPTRRKRCQTAVHEFGHLLGREHSRNPRSVMFWKATPRNVPRGCR